MRDPTPTPNLARTPLPPEVGSRLGPFYVYLLIDPRNDQPFYVGKGTGARLLAHGIEAELGLGSGRSDKVNRIKSIRAVGLEPRLDVVRHGLAEDDALLVEASLIDCLPGLTNKVAGHGVTSGRTPLTELIVRYGAPDLSVEDPPALLIRLRARRIPLESPEELEPGYHRHATGWYSGIPPLDLLDATRGWWKVNPRSVENRGVHHVVAVAEGVTRGLFELVSWIGPNEEGRWAFMANIIEAGDEWREYVGGLGRRVPFPLHSQNPLSYWPPRRPLTR